MKKLPELTRREREVLSVLCEPLKRGDAFTEPASIRHIATALGVSDAAVKQHLVHLYDKFGVFEGEERRRLRLANIAIGLGANARDGEPAAPWGPASEDLTQGRIAAKLRNWPRAYDLLSAADRTVALQSAEDLEHLGEAAMVIGRHDESIAIRQRAHAIHVRNGEVTRAAMVELALVFNYAGRLNFAQASAWFAKASRSLSNAQPGLAHGYLAATEALFKLGSGDAKAAAELARNATVVARRLGDSDLHALGLAFHGQAMAQLGSMAEAAPMLDEAMAIASSGECGYLVTGLVYCRTICACLDAFDYCRAREWTEAMDRLAGDPRTAGFPGDCRAHRATLFALRGDWTEAEREARIACAEGERIDLSHSALANYEIGLVRLRSGDFDSAAASFGRAIELGMNAQPGLALLQLERGDVAAAASSIRTAVEETASLSLRRARLLQAQAEIALLSDDGASAAAAATELARIADANISVALKASAMSSLGIASLAQGDAPSALGQLREACRLWLNTNAPYDAARIRMHTASALRALDDNTSARLEIEAARRVFEQLGAGPDLARAIAALGEFVVAPLASSTRPRTRAATS